MPKKIYIIGAGIAGLSLAYYLINKKNDYQIEIFESSPHLGGRCRSFFNKELGIKTDNGNHLTLLANKNLVKIIDDLGIWGNFHKPKSDLSLYDIKTNVQKHYESLSELVSSLNYKDKFSLFLFLSLNRINKQKFKNSGGRLHSEFLNPLCRAILNTPYEEADLSGLRKVLLKIFSAGSKGMQYFYPIQNWDDALIQPLYNYLVANGVKITTESTLSSCNRLDNLINTLNFNDKNINLSAEDIVIFATSFQNTSKILGGYQSPYSFQSILNIHFKTDGYTNSGKIIGVNNSGYIEWVFGKSDHVSVTVSAANDIIKQGSEVLAQNCWEELKLVLGLSSDSKIPEYSVIKEKRATFEYTAQNLSLRPDCHTIYSNCFLTGDFIKNALPSTIEGAILNSKNLSNIIC